ncbi:hypothetical protein J6590_069775 [Homalodisca vitripennis]|nr:hypothetical protein J6590_069775 [Homalodisca vitripennis]
MENCYLTERSGNKANLAFNPSPSPTPTGVNNSHCLAVCGQGGEGGRHDTVVVPGTNQGEWDTIRPTSKGRHLIWQ